MDAEYGVLGAGRYIYGPGARRDQPLRLVETGGQHACMRANLPQLSVAQGDGNEHTTDHGDIIRRGQRAKRVLRPPCKSQTALAVSSATANPPW